MKLEAKFKPNNGENMSSEAKNDSAEQAGTEPASAKPDVPPMAPFRLALEELEHQHRDAVRRLGEWASGVNDPAQLKFAHAAGETHAFLHAVMVLREAIKEASSHGEAGTPTA
jgi:hypothetical protein